MEIWQVPANPVESQRSGEWQALRWRFVQAHPQCECCGRTEDLHVHHVVPVHVDASRELDESNLISLCDRCHLVVGHLNSWHRDNPRIREDARLLRSRQGESWRMD